MLEIAEHPLLDLGSFVTEYPRALGEMESPQWLVDLLAADCEAPLQSSDEVRKTVRDLLRHGGFRPTGRSKPASEYLIRAASEDRLGGINVAVDACNAVSLHSGLPISIVDLDRAGAQLRVDIAASGSRYVFNSAGQEIDVGGLLCLFDREGPCANAVKDAQRTKTDGSSTRTLSIVWGTNALPGRMDDAVAWYRDVVARSGGVTRRTSE